MQEKKIEIKVNDLSPMILFLVIWTILLWVLVFVLLVAMISRPSEIGSLGFLWIVMIGVGILSANHVIWEFVGKVRIVIGPNRVLIKNINNLFKKEVIIPLKDFQRIEFNKEKNFYHTDIWGITQGDILVFYKNGQRRFGKGMNKIESYKSIKRIEKEIKNYAQH